MPSFLTWPLPVVYCIDESGAKPALGLEIASCIEIWLQVAFRRNPNSKAFEDIR